MATTFPTSWKSRAVRRPVTTTFPKSLDLNTNKFNKGNASPNLRYDSAAESVRNPTYSNFLQDNLFRLLAGNGNLFLTLAFERLITSYQVYPILRASTYFPGTLSHTFTEITN